jgi:hypothetical protein
MSMKVFDFNGTLQPNHDLRVARRMGQLQLAITPLPAKVSALVSARSFECQRFGFQVSKYVFISASLR